MTQATSQSKRVVQQNHSDDEIDLLRLVGVLLDRKWAIAAFTLVFAVFGVAYAILATPIYKADALIQVEEKSAGMPGLSDLTEMFASDSSAVTEIELLKSRFVLGQAVEKLDLDILVEPKRFPLIGNYIARKHVGEGLNDPLLGDSYAWGGEQINVAQLSVPSSLNGQPLTLRAESDGTYSLYFEDELLLKGQLGERVSRGGIELVVTDLLARPGTEFTLVKRDPIDAIKDLQQTLSVSEKGKQSGILYLSMEGEDKALIQKTLDAIADAYLLQNVQRMSAEAEKSLNFLKEQLPQIKSELNSSEEKLNQYRLQNDSVDLSLETKSVLDQLVNLETKLNELALSESDITRRFTKEHPNYVAFQKKKDELQAERGRLTDEIKALPATQQEVLRMTRDVEVNQQIYLALLNKVQELNVAKAGTVGNVRIVDSAQAGYQPVKPKKALIAVIATLLGGFIGVVYALVKAALNRGVENPEAFEQIGLSVYASIPYSNDHFKRFNAVKKVKDPQHIRQSQLLAAYNPADLAIESIRSLRTSLHFAMMEAKNNVLVIGGPSPSIGKSFVSANLAAVIAQAGKKVLVVDADMRKGYMQRIFRLQWDNGLSDHLVGDIGYEQAIKETEVDNLHFVSRGRIPPNPSELLMHQRFSEFLQRASQEYDLVLIDTPPILAVTDSAIVSNHAGTTLMVARFGQNPLKEVEVAARRFEQNGIEVKGIIFNAVERKASAYGYYGNYGYYNYEYKSKA